MEKEKQYRELIADVKRFYESEARLHQHEPLYLGWYDGCEEINLWTYWQGRGCLDARIMLVGQDWGSPGDCSDRIWRSLRNSTAAGAALIGWTAPA